MSSYPESREEAGLQVGDVIVDIDDDRVRSTTEVQKIIDAVDIRAQQTLKLKVYREGKLYEVDLKLEQS